MRDANDVHGVTHMRLRNDAAAWGTWEPFAVTRTWTLPEQEGEHTVWVQFRDPAASVSVAYSDSIVYKSPHHDPESHFVHLPLVLCNSDPAHPPPPIVQTLDFKVSFQARSNVGQNVPIKVKIKSLSGDQVLFETDWVSVTPADGSDNWGTASVDVSSAVLTSGQSYQVSVRGAMHLAKQVTIPLIDDLTIDYTDPGLNPDGVLWAYGINQDNQVTNADVTIQLSQNSETSPPNPNPSSEVYRSDQNSDGAINSFDYAICVSNSGKVSDPY